MINYELLWNFFWAPTDIRHHGILGQKWGVRRYQNKDGSLTPAGLKRYNEGVSNAKKFADTHSELERMTRELRRDVPAGNQILVPTDVKKHYEDLFNDFMKQSKIMGTKYGYATSEIKSMDDGYDYAEVLLKDNKLGGYIQYYSLVGKTEK